MNTRNSTTHPAPLTGPDGEPADTALPAFTRQRPFGFLLLATGVVGFIASGILVLERLELYKDSGHTTSCDINPWVSCGRVMKTWQSELFGFPNPLIGIAAFAVIITIAMAILSGARFSRWYWLGLQAGVTLGMVFVAWLWSQALFEIYILCLYCMVVWAAMIPMFILLTVKNMAHGIIKVPAGLARAASEWAWTLVAVVYVGVAASIFLRFFNAFLGT